MILHCKNCGKVLSVKNEKLLENDSRVKCPSCGQITVVAPKMAMCGKCATRIKYYEYKLNPEKPLVACPNCGSVNKVKVNNTTFLVLKDQQ